MAEAHVREARAERDVVSGSLWPSVGSSVSYSRNRWAKTAFLRCRRRQLDYNLYNAGFDAAWELDIFGGTRRAVEAANAEIGRRGDSASATCWSRCWRKSRGITSKARGYQQRLAITRQNIQVQQEILDLTSNRFRKRT